MQNILLIEDDPDITKLINLHFDETQYKITSCITCEEGLRYFTANQYHLIILDISLPDGNGMELCKKIRATDVHTPLMMLTCHAEESDKVLALELGADDYVTKPFGILELMARVKAIMRRSTQLKEELVNKEIIIGELMLDPDKRKVCLHEKRLELTVKEFDLLWLLASNPGKTFSRKDLLEKIWGFAFSGYEHTITSHINRLRLKLESDLNNPKFILTAWGTGYRFAE